MNLINEDKLKEFSLGARKMYYLYVKDTNYLVGAYHDIHRAFDIGNELSYKLDKFIEMTEIKRFSSEVKYYYEIAERTYGKSIGYIYLNKDLAIKKFNDIIKVIEQNSDMYIIEKYLTNEYLSYIQNGLKTEIVFEEHNYLN